MNEITESPFELPSPWSLFTVPFLLIQAAIFALWLVLAILAIRRAAKHTEGSATPLWILLVFLVPYFGAITTLACVKRGAAHGR